MNRKIEIMLAFFGIYIILIQYYGLLTSELKLIFALGSKLSFLGKAYNLICFDRFEVRSINEHFVVIS